jgi:hypothetical protein
MIDRLKWRLEEPEDRVPDQDFWEIWCGLGAFYVSRETAAEVLAVLARIRLPRWIHFTDLFGSEVRVRGRDVRQVVESTRDQRAAERTFRRAQRDERKADRRPWEDDDDLW